MFDDSLMTERYPYSTNLHINKLLPIMATEMETRGANRTHEVDIP